MALLCACSIDVAERRLALTGTATVTASYGLRLRSGPSTSYAVIAVMPKDTVVEVLGGPDNGFYNVRYDSGTSVLEGFAHGSLLAVVQTPDAGTQPIADGGTALPYQGIVVGANAINLRSGPSTSYAVVDILYKGTVVDLLGGYQNGYYRVRHNSNNGPVEGWAYETFLDISAVVIAPPDPDSGVDAAPSADEFSYPVGDRSTYPAGGFSVWQVLGHYHTTYGGRHLAQDLASAQGGYATINAPVYSVADGLVRYAGYNGSTYRNVVLIEHPLSDGTSICSFYGHINPPSVHTGDTVSRGDQIATVMDWNIATGKSSSNTHLHYVFLSKGLCDASAAAAGNLVCGYDKGGNTGVYTISQEPASLTSINDVCNDYLYPNAFISPTKFIEAHKAP
jgi:murein DD-endopeptidase MepM/ murein hydrolase activator NlpD